MIPFFLSALFFLSVFFTLIAPFPLLIFFLKGGMLGLFLALAANSVLIYLVAEAPMMVVYLVTTGVTSFCLPYFLLEKRHSLQKTTLLTLLAMLISLSLGGLIHWKLNEVSPNLVMDELVAVSVKRIEEASIQGGSNLEKDYGLTADQFRKKFKAEIPSMILLYGFSMIFLNLMLLLRLNPSNLTKILRLKKGFFSSYKAAEWLVWPSIAMGAIKIFGDGLIQEIGVNGFNFFMIFYAVQGLSILNFFFAQWKVGAWIRPFLYLLSIYPMLPLLLGIGFFDLWFDFRAKFRQT